MGKLNITLPTKILEFPENFRNPVRYTKSVAISENGCFAAVAGWEGTRKTLIELDITNNGRLVGKWAMENEVLDPTAIGISNTGKLAWGGKDQKKEGYVNYPPSLTGTVGLEGQELPSPVD